MRLCSIESPHDRHISRRADTDEIKSAAGRNQCDRRRSSMGAALRATGDVEPGVRCNVRRECRCKRARIGMCFTAARRAATRDDAEHGIIGLCDKPRRLGHLIEPFCQHHAPWRHAQCVRAASEMVEYRTRYLSKRNAHHRALREKARTLGGHNACGLDISLQGFRQPRAGAQMSCHPPSSAFGTA